MKKFLCALSVICLMLAGVSCSKSQTEAKTEFENMMNAFQSCDKTQINRYYSYDSLTAYLEEEQGELLSDAVLKTLSVMEYQVNSVNKVSDTAVKINADITTVDFSAVMESYMQKVTALIETADYKKEVKSMPDDAYKALMAEQMMKAIDENFDSRVTKTVDITMIKGENGWTLGGRSEEFLGILFENLSNAVEALV